MNEESRANVPPMRTSMYASATPLGDEEERERVVEDVAGSRCEHGIAGS